MDLQAYGMEPGAIQMASSCQQDRYCPFTVNGFSQRRASQWASSLLNHAINYFFLTPL